MESVNNRYHYHWRNSTLYKLHITAFRGGTAAAAPPPFRLGDPALCGRHPLVTQY